jgi:hypothetical protein
VQEGVTQVTHGIRWARRVEESLQAVGIAAADRYLGM